MDLSQLCVVTCISNPVRYKSRYELYRKFEKMCHDAGVTFVTIEQAFGDRDFVLTTDGDPLDLQVRSIDELWHKENMLNLAIAYAVQKNPKLKYVAWVDADVFPMRDGRDWFEETWHQLQHYQVVQMFEWSVDLDPNYNQLSEKRHGFIAKYFQEGFVPPTVAGKWRKPNDPNSYYGGGYGVQGHSGFAWAASIDALNAVGGLIDKAILGAGDWHMAHGLVGAMSLSIPHIVSPQYKKYLLSWEKLATRHIKRDVGYVSGTIYHYWHGKKVDRKYWDRWKILADNDYDPYKDLKRDAQGLYQLESYYPRQLMLRDQVRAYFRQRNEDSIDV